MGDTPPADLGGHDRRRQEVPGGQPRHERPRVPPGRQRRRRGRHLQRASTRSTAASCGTPTGPQDRRRHQRRRRQEGDGRPRQRDGAADRPRARATGSSTRSTPRSARARSASASSGSPRWAACSIRRAPSSARPRRRSSSKLAFAPLPKQDTDQRAARRHGPAHLASTSRPSNQAEALNFIKWFQTPEAQKKWAQLGGVPARNDVLKSPEFLDAQPYNKVFTESVPRLKDFWNLPEYAKLLNVHSTQVNAAISGTEAARRGARQAAPRTSRRSSTRAATEQSHQKAGRRASPAFRAPPADTPHGRHASDTPAAPPPVAEAPGAARGGALPLPHRPPARGAVHRAGARAAAVPVDLAADLADLAVVHRLLGDARRARQLHRARQLRRRAHVARSHKRVRSRR